jgi:phospholipase/carboxylesterase
MLRHGLLALALFVGACNPTPPSRPETMPNAPSALVSIRIPPRTPVPGKPPLLVLLHGYGADEHDLAGLAPHLDGRFDIRSARGPQALAQGGYAWFALKIQPDGERQFNEDEAESSRKLVLRFIHEAVEADDADPERVYVAGFSQGGILASSIALTVPDRVAGVVAMSARILPSAVARRVSDEALAGLPILVVHGTQDTMLPVENGRASRALLSSLPVALTYREFPMPHTISHDSLNLVSSWLTARLDEPERRERLSR